MTRFTSLVFLRTDKILKILSEHFSRSLYNSSHIIVPYRINMPSNNATATSLSVVLGTFFCVSLYVHQHFVIIKWNCRKNRSRLEWDLSKKGYDRTVLRPTVIWPTVFWPTIIWPSVIWPSVIWPYCNLTLTKKNYFT